MPLPVAGSVVTEPKKRKREEEAPEPDPVTTLISRDDRRLLKMIEAHAINATAVFDERKEWFGTYGDWKDRYASLIAWMRLFVLSGLFNNKHFILGVSDPDMFDCLSDVLEQFQESVQLERGFQFEDSTPFDKATDDGLFLIRNIKRYVQLIYALHDKGLLFAFNHYKSRRNDLLIEYQENVQPWKSDLYPMLEPSVALYKSLKAARQDVQLIEEIIKCERVETYCSELAIDNGDEDFHGDCPVVLMALQEEMINLSYSGLEQE